MAEIYRSIHIAGQGNKDEANDHAVDDNGGIFGQSSDHKVAIVEVDSNQSLLKLLDEILQLNEPINYLDFHTHGYGGTADLGADQLKLDTLDQYRNRGYEKIFALGATIKFLGCSIARCNFRQEDEDGELFLAEFAAVFLQKSGGTCYGASDYIHYRPTTVWRGPRFDTDGTWVAAEFAPGAREATLKGHYYLDADRIRQEIMIMTEVLQSMMRTSVPTSPSTGPFPAAVQAYIDDFVEKHRLQDLELARVAMKLLDAASVTVGKGRPPLRTLDKAADLLETAVIKLDDHNVPISQVMVPMLRALRSQPISP